MEKHLDILASKANISRYQSLLTREWTRRTLEEVLSLLWSEIGQSLAAQDLPFAEVLDPERAKPGREPNPEILDHIRLFARFFEHNGLPRMPVGKRFEPKKNRLISQAEMSWAYLVLHTLVPLRGPVGFFLDSQSLLFLSTVHFLLPSLKEHNFLAEHDCLVNALSMHAYTAWTDQPEHFFYLQSVLMDYLGEEKNKEEYLRLSLQLTPVMDESYLTKVQDYWFTLLDQGKPEKAWSFLLSVYRNAPRDQLEELEEMMACVRRRLP